MFPLPHIGNVGLILHSLLVLLPTFSLSVRPISPWSSCLPLNSQSSKRGLKNVNQVLSVALRPFGIKSKLHTMIQEILYDVFPYLSSLPCVFLLAVVLLPHCLLLTAVFYALSCVRVFGPAILCLECSPPPFFSSFRLLGKCHSREVIFPHLIHTTYVSHSHHLFGSFVWFPIYAFLSYLSLVKFCPNWNISIKKAGTSALLCVIISLLPSRVLDHNGLHKYLMNEWMVDE